MIRDRMGSDVVGWTRDAALPALNARQGLKGDRSVTSTRHGEPGQCPAIPIKPRRTEMPGPNLAADRGSQP
jgi:hypothetical protein